MGGITSWNIYGEAFAFPEFSIKLEWHDTKGRGLRIKFVLMALCSFGFG